MKETVRSLSNSYIALIAEETQLAWQWDRSVRRVHHPDINVQKGFAFEEMAKDANNWRNPLNKIKLMEDPGFKAIDGVAKDGTRIQFKASNNGGYQLRGLKGLQPEGGKVIVPKGNKAVKSPDVVEAPFGQDRIYKAAEAKAAAKTVAGLAARQAVIGGLVAGGMEAVSNLDRLQNGEITPKEFGMGVASEAGYGAAAAVPVVLVGVAATAACAPAAVTVGAGIAVGAAANVGVRKAVSLIKRIW